MLGCVGGGTEQATRPTLSQLCRLKSVVNFSERHKTRWSPDLKVPNCEMVGRGAQTRKKIPLSHLEELVVINDPLSVPSWSHRRKDGSRTYNQIRRLKKKASLSVYLRGLLILHATACSSRSLRFTSSLYSLLSSTRGCCRMTWPNISLF